MPVVEAGELQIGLVCVAIAPFGGGCLASCFCIAASGALPWARSRAPLPMRRGAAAGIAVGDVDRTLLDQVHDSAQVAADHLQSLDAERLLPRNVQGVVDVGDQPVCAR